MTSETGTTGAGVSITGDGRAAIEKTIVVDESALFANISAENYSEVFELERCISWVKENDFKQICLQFPDEYLTYSPEIVDYLAEKTGQRFYILADSTYGSCCVDEKTALHVPAADTIIHFGPSCLSCTSGRFPVLYVFTKPQVDVTRLEKIYTDNFETDQKVIILYDVIYKAAVEDLHTKIADKFPLVKLSNLVVPLNTKDANTSESNPVLTDNIIKHNRIIPCNSTEELESHKIFFVGQRSLPNLLLLMPNNIFKVYDPAQTSVESLSTQTSAINKLIRKRSFYIEKIKDASVVGILVGTLVVQNYLSLIDRLKEILRKAGKEFFIVSIGEVNPYKLGNFMDIECFVFVGCPEVVNYYISDESKGQFFQPILTPYDAELAFCESEGAWGQTYVIDWNFLVQKGEPKVKEILEDVSLITGAMRSAVINTSSEHSNASGSGVVNWLGLNDKEDCETDPNIIYEGRSGIAASYSDEPSVK